LKIFACDNCGHVLFFENDRCTNCGKAVGYCVETQDLATLSAAPAEGVTYEVAVGADKRSYRSCKNAFEDHACNWLVPSESESTFCRSCALTEIIPDLSEASNRQAWIDIERAKRRLIYTIDGLKLPLASRLEEPEVGLAFRFLRSSEGNQVMTGHADGVVTLNVAEAESAFCENMREKMGEAYRTVLGHLRHESGHYYWDRLVRDGNLLEAFRKEFGDETLDYQEAVKRHYEQGSPANWAETCISAYATMHPWEDWAETWAHYMHMVDTLETAKSHGLTVLVPGAEQKGERIATHNLAFRDFESLSAGWHAVTIALNSLNRSMGMKDVYPFVVSPRVQDKLRFIHEVVHARRAEAPKSAKAPNSKAYNAAAKPSPRKGPAPASKRA